MAPCTLIDIACLSYDDGLRLQRSAVERLQANSGGESLILLEHPPVITLEPHQEDSLEPSLAYLEKIWPW